jgi:hypothetical protein
MSASLFLAQRPSRFQLTVSAAIGSMHMTVRRPIRFIFSLPPPAIPAGGDVEEADRSQ